MTFNMDLLVDLSQSIKDTLSGPVGEFYWCERQDDLESFVKIIQTYIKPVKSQIDKFIELRLQGEILDKEETEKIVDLIYQVKNNIKDILYSNLLPFFNFEGNSRLLKIYRK